MIIIEEELKKNVLKLITKNTQSPLNKKVCVSICWLEFFETEKQILKLSIIIIIIIIIIIDLARELKKLWNMKVTIVQIVIGAFGTITKGLLKGLEDLEVGGRVETIQMTALLRTARILRKVLETWGDLLSLKLQRINIQLILMWKNL